MKQNSNLAKSNTDSWNKLNSNDGLLKKLLNFLMSKIHASRSTLINLSPEAYRKIANITVLLRDALTTFFLLFGKITWNIKENCLKSFYFLFLE